MDPATLSLSAASNLISSAITLAKGIAHPTHPLYAYLTHITSTPLARAHHSLSVVKGRAYIFGGETADGVLADNKMNIVILPSSGVLEADFTSVEARGSEGEDGEMMVPSARKRHTSVVVGDDILVYGGEGSNGEQVDETLGRVWVFSTVDHSWRFLDPDPGSVPEKMGCRAGHMAVAAELPAPKSTVFVERAPQRPADPAKAVPEPAEPCSWGTMFVIGGRIVGEKEKGTENEAQEEPEALAFDIRTRTWSQIPTPDDGDHASPSLALVGDHLYRFSGRTTDPQSMQRLDVSPVWKHAEGGTTPTKLGWGWEEVFATPPKGANSEPSSSSVLGPDPRSGAGMEAVTTGQGRKYLLLLGGERAGEVEGKADLLRDIWSFQLPSEYPSAASIKDSTRTVLKRDTHQGEWAEVKYKYLDAKGDEVTKQDDPQEPDVGIGGRSGFAVARGTEVDGASVVVWGGRDDMGRVLSDGWLVTVDR